MSLVLERDGSWPEPAAKREDLLRQLEARGVRIRTLAEIRVEQQERQRRLDEAIERKRRERAAKRDGGNH